MMRPKVLNLIQKFEQLSNDISTSKCPPVRQKSVTIPIRLTTPPPAPFVEPPPVCNQAGWNNKSFVDIEVGIKGLKKMMSDINPGDEKMILSMFMEMMDLLIRLSSVDTDGLKHLKAKKECCLTELKNAKNDLTTLITSNANLECTPAEVSKCNKSLVNIVDSTDEDTEDDALPVLHTSQYDMEAKNNIFPKSGVVHSLTKQFEVPCQKASQDEKRKEVPNIYKSLSVLDTDSDEESEPSGDSNPRKMSLNDINSEIAYYKEVVPALDFEDFVKIESIEEHLQGLMVSAENYVEAKEEIAILLNHVKDLKDGDCLVCETGDETTIVSKSPAEINTATLIDLYMQSNALIQTDQACVFVANKVIPEIVVEESVDPQKDAPATTIHLLNINIPGDDGLTESMVMIESYKTQIQDYLKLPDRQLLEMEATIDENIATITNFTPHPKVEAQFNELRTTYKQLLDFITESKFASIFNETIEENGDGPINNSDSVEINTFYALCSEIGNYYPYMEKLDESPPSQIELLRENLAEVAEEIQKYDLSDNENLQSVKENALQELENMLKQL